MKAIELYLSKLKYEIPKFQISAPSLLDIIVVIPCFNEPDISKCIDSLEKCFLDEIFVEIILVVNHSISANEDQKNTNVSLIKWCHNRPFKLPVHIIYLQDMPEDKAGVGFARKSGMDAALIRFKEIGNANGIIISLDADTWVEQNYFNTVLNEFRQTNHQCLVIHFEHDLADCRDNKQLQAIIAYELHLRYYIQALRFAGFPHAVQTLGSAFAVKANAYAAQGGMPARSAAEDFYFIHKFSKINKLGSVTTTMVHPSPRLSERVPFGTGKALIDLLNSELDYTSYAWQSFIDLKLFLDQSSQLYFKNNYYDWSFSTSLISFLNKIGFESILKELKSNSSHLESFIKRFWQKLDAFQMMKYVHHCRDHHYPNEGLNVCVKKLLDQVGINYLQTDDNLALLNILRMRDKVKT